jgi:hypothetical protein
MRQRIAVNREIEKKVRIGQFFRRREKIAVVKRAASMPDFRRPVYEPHRSE